MFLLLNSTTANASTVTYSNQFSGTTTVSNQAINVAQFDPTLGTLTSATFDLSANMTTQAKTTTGGDFYLGWDKMTYTLSLGGNGLSISSSLPATRILGTGTPGTTFNPLTNMLYVSTTNPVTYSGPTLNPSNTFVESTSLSPFIGTGTLSFLLNAVSDDTLGVSDLSGAFGVTSNVLGTVKVSYTYLPAAVPIPPASWLFGSGLLGLVGMARRKKAA